MRAWDILLFMLSFNAAVWLLQSQNIFGGIGPSGGILSLPTELSVAVLVTAITAASVTVFGTRMSRPIVAGVSGFAFLYTITLESAMAILYHIHIPLEIITVMGGLNGFIFAIAILQMVTGGWRTYR